MKSLKNVLCATMVTVMTSCAPAFAESFLDVHDKPLEDQWVVAIGGWSKHVLGLSDNVTNENHKILGVEHKSYSIGYFENSYGHDTFFVAKTWRTYPGVTIPLELSLSLGVNYGYKECFGRGDGTQNFCPHGYIGLAWTQWKIVPSFKFQPGVVLFSPEVRF